MVKVVTSCTGKQWREYGEAMHASVKRHLTDNIVVYGEGMDHETDGFVDLFKAEPECKAFIDRNEAWTAPIVKERGYRFDACKFARKVFAIKHALQNVKGDELTIWLDADVIVKSPVPQGFLDDIRKAASEIAILDRDHTHTESGIVVFTPVFVAQDLVRAWAELYETDAIFHLAGWTDAHALDFVMKSLNCGYLSLSGEARKGMNPFNEGPLGQWFSHYKGPGKLQNNPNVPASVPVGRPERYKQLLGVIDAVKPRSICEVGTWNGERAVQMMKRAYRYRMNAKYWGFDLFEDATEETDLTEFNVKPHHNVRDVARKLRSHGIDCHLTKGNTRETLQSLPSEQQFDLAYIDGGHSLETIRSDYEALKDRAKVIVFDDYYTGVDTDRYGCNQLVEALGGEILPVKDAVEGGGTVQMAIVRQDAA